MTPLGPEAKALDLSISGPLLRRFSDAGNHDANHARGRAAFEKRQGTKSRREVVRGGAAGAMAIWPRPEGRGGWRGAGAAIGCW